VPTITGEGTELKFIYKQGLQHNPWMRCHVLLRCVTSLSIGIFEGQHQIFCVVIDFAGLTPCPDDGSLLCISGDTRGNALHEHGSNRMIVLYSQKSKAASLDRHAIVAALNHSNERAASTAHLATEVDLGCQFP
jgi:hypothetical protein